MSKIFENKTFLIHIAAEIIIIIGVSFYFSQKNKKLMGHINDLVQRIEEQEDILQKHEQLIINLNNALNDINTTIFNKSIHTESNISNKNNKKNVKQPLSQVKQQQSTSQHKQKQSISQPNQKQSTSKINTSLNNNNLRYNENIINPNKEIGIEFHFVSPSSASLQKNKNEFNSKVEEIIDENEDENEEENLNENEDENEDENLDKELEEELNDLLN